jgi:hypothetical protein
MGHEMEGGWTRKRKRSERASRDLVKCHNKKRRERERERERGMRGGRGRGRKSYRRKRRSMRSTVK